MTCTESTQNNEAGSNFLGNGYLQGSGSSRTCYYGNVQCGNGISNSGNGDSTTVLGWGWDDGNLNDDEVEECKPGSAMCTDGSASNASSTNLRGNGNLDDPNDQCYYGAPTCTSGTATDGPNEACPDHNVSSNTCYWSERCEDKVGCEYDNSQSMEPYCSGDQLNENASCSDSGPGFDSRNCNALDAAGSETDSGIDYDTQGTCTSATDGFCDSSGTAQCDTTGGNSDTDFCNGGSVYEFYLNSGSCSLSIYSCSNLDNASDDDGGNSPDTAGTCTEIDGSCGSGACQTSTTTNQDSCTNSTHLNEYFNNSNQCQVNNHNCGDIECRSFSTSPDRCWNCDGTTEVSCAILPDTFNDVDTYCKDGFSVDAPDNICESFCVGKDVIGDKCDGRRFGCGTGTVAEYSGYRIGPEERIGSCGLNGNDDQMEVDCECTTNAATTYKEEERS